MERTEKLYLNSSDTSRETDNSAYDYLGILDQFHAKIDKVSIYGFIVEEIEDINLLAKENIVTINQNKENYLRTRSGQEYSVIKIDASECFDRFIYSISPDGKVYGELQLSIQDKYYKNLICFSAAEYRMRIEEVKVFLIDRYGIWVDFAHAKYRSLEINKTIVLNSPYEDYCRVLELMTFLFPANLRLKKESIWSRNEKTKKLLESRRKDESITLSSGKKGLTIKIYDKTKALDDKYRIILLDNILRFEITLNCSTKIKNSLGCNSLWSMRDEIIYAYFSQFVERNIKKPYIKYCEDRDRVLRQLLKQYYVPNSHTWRRDVVLAICNHEILNKVPLILSIEELSKQLDCLNFSSASCKSHTKKQLIKLAETSIEAFNRGDNNKYEELIAKLE